MATQCQGCDGKFGAMGDPSAGVDSYDVSDTTVSADVTVSVECANCGSEFLSGSISLEQEIDVDSHDSDCAITDPETGQEVTLESNNERFDELCHSERTFEITDVDVQVEESFDKSKRRFYDVTATFSVRCLSCGGELEVVSNDALYSSELESVY